MNHTKSTALERLVIQLLGGLNRFYGIPTLALGLDKVHDPLLTIITECL